MELNKAVKTTLGFALLLIVLGFANILFGQHKSNEYLSLLSKASQELASPETPQSVPLLNPYLNTDKQSQYINMLKARIDFYTFVMLGGRCLLALAGVLLAACIVIMKRAPADDRDQNPGGGSGVP